MKIKKGILFSDNKDLSVAAIILLQNKIKRYLARKKGQGTRYQLIMSGAINKAINYDNKASNSFNFYIFYESEKSSFEIILFEKSSKKSYQHYEHYGLQKVTAKSEKDRILQNQIFPFKILKRSDRNVDLARRIRINF